MKTYSIDNINFNSLYIKKCNAQKLALQKFVNNDEKVLSALENCFAEIDKKSFNKDVYLNLNEAIIGNGETGYTRTGWTFSLHNKSGKPFIDNVNVERSATQKEKIIALKYLASAAPNFKTKPTITNIIERYSK